MCRLKKKIAAIEEELELDNEIIDEECFLLGQQMHTTENILLGMAGSFIFGYYFAKNQKLSELPQKLLSFSLTVKPLYEKLKVMFPIIY